MAVPATAQEHPYDNRELEVHFSVPGSWTLRDKDFPFGWDNPKVNLRTLAEFLSEDTQVGGILIYEMNAGWEADNYADAVEKNLKTALPSTERVAQKESGTDREVREYKYKLDGNVNEFHQIRVYTLFGKHNFQFAIWCFEDLWKDYQDSMYKVVNSVRQGDSPVSGAGSGNGADEPTTELDVPADLWDGWGAGSSLTYESESSGIKMEMKYVLLDHKVGVYYTLRTATTVMENTTETVIRYNVKKSESGGTGAGPEAPKVKELARGEAEIEVSGRKLKCTWVETEMEAGGSKVHSKTWTSEEIANGGLVRSESIVEMTGMKTELKMVLKAFEKK